MGSISEFTATFGANLPRGSPLTIPHAKTPLPQTGFLLTIQLENEAVPAVAGFAEARPKQKAARKETGN
jgi:hypothetical protein